MTAEDVVLGLGLRLAILLSTKHIWALQQLYLCRYHGEGWHFCASYGQNLMMSKEKKYAKEEGSDVAVRLRNWDGGLFDPLWELRIFLWVKTLRYTELLTLAPWEHLFWKLLQLSFLSSPYPFQNSFPAIAWVDYPHCSVAFPGAKSNEIFGFMVTSAPGKWEPATVL